MPPSDTPNFLIIMSDEHGPMFSSTYGHRLVDTSNMDRLAARGTTFDAHYSNSPLCVPSRLSFMTGKFVSTIRGWDNATPLYLGELTWPYLLRSRGYDTALDGKMHMLGRHALHGFDEQIAHDPHAANAHPVFTWDDTPRPPANAPDDYDLSEHFPQAGEPWPEVINARSGTSKVIEDDQTFEDAAHAYLRDPARREKPFALCVGFIAPHFPFAVPEPYFSRYYPDRVDMPNNPPGHLEDLPVAAVRLRRMFGLGGPYTDDQVMRARAAYYGMIDQLDDRIGRLMDTLEAEGLAENTVIIHTSDHGEMLGEHGLWRKMCFYEQSARVPLQISWPGRLPEGQRIAGVTSNVDVTATILDLAGVSPAEWNLDGDSLLPLMRGEAAEWKDEAFVEHLAHGTDRPRAMIRSGKYKLSYNHGSPPEFELYDLEADPGEFDNRADDPALRDVRDRLLARILDKWGDADAMDAEIRASQKARLLMREVMTADRDF
ncbi:MAG: sulfatase-like hydrolase/transferase [Chloroflexi bacterium]|nr:sulfatase-like hydrolase/transferase [Chloroflexota bacterium]